MKPLSKQELFLGWCKDKHIPAKRGEIEDSQILEDGSVKITLRFKAEYIAEEPWKTSYEEQLASFFEYKKRVLNGEKSARVARDVGLTKQRLGAFLKAGPPYPRGYPGTARVCTHCSRAAAKANLCPIHYAQALGIDTDVALEAEEELANSQ